MEASSWKATVSIDDLNLISVSIERYIVQSDNDELRIALDKMSENPSFWTGLLLSMSGRDQQLGTPEVVEAIPRNRIDLLRLYTEVLLAIMKRQLDALIESVGTAKRWAGDLLASGNGDPLRSQSAMVSKTIRRIEQMTETVYAGQRRFVHLFAIEMKSSVEFKNDEQARKNVNDLVGRYFGTLHQLMEDFFERLTRRPDVGDD